MGSRSTPALTEIVPAGTADLDAVRSLLRRAGLPIVGVEEHFSTFLVARNGRRIVGAIGLESYGTSGLLRSAVVDQDFRGEGIGSLLYNGLIGMARDRGIKKLVLLTNTAEEYFSKKGFRPIDRKSLSGPVTSSVEFSDACPSHAVCMELVL